MQIKELELRFREDREAGGASQPARSQAIC